MGTPVRSSTTSPIQEFVYTPSVDTCDFVNALVADLNRYLASFAFGNPVLSFTFASLPTVPPIAVEGAEVWVSDGRKIGEEGITGTGVWAYRSGGVWLRESTDSPVTASAVFTITTEAGANILTEAGGTITTGG